MPETHNLLGEIKALHGFLEQANQSLASGNTSDMHTYATAARAVLMNLDNALDYSCDRLAAEMHEVYSFMIRLIDKAVSGMAPSEDLNTCFKLAKTALILFSAENESASHA